MSRSPVAPELKLHDSVVKDVLDKYDMPFAYVETTWFRNGERHRYKGKMMRIQCDKKILISSYVDYNGKLIRISNHEKKNGYPDNMINYIYDDAGKIIKEKKK